MSDRLYLIELRKLALEAMKTQLEAYQWSGNKGFKENAKVLGEVSRSLRQRLSTLTIS